MNLTIRLAYGILTLGWLLVSGPVDGHASPVDSNSPSPVSGSISAVARVELPLGMTVLTPGSSGPAVSRVSDPLLVSSEIKSPSFRILYFPHRTGMVMKVEINGHEARHYDFGDPDAQANEIFLPGPTAETIIVDLQSMTAGQGAGFSDITITIIYTGI